MNKTSRPILKIKNLNKSFSGKKVLDNVNIEVKSGEIYGFIGHNGAGKSTTIKQIVGILPIDDGEIEICGYSVKGDPLNCKSHISYVPDNPDVYEFLTGIQYLNFISDIFKIDATARISKIEEFSKRLKIDTALGDVISSYSHGMKQKLVLVGALIHDPDLIVLDEPFVGLDPVASHEVKEILKEKVEEGVAVFFSSHVLEVVEKLCNKVAIIKQGKIIKSGLTSDIVGDESLEELFLELADDNSNAKE